MVQDPLTKKIVQCKNIRSCKSDPSPKTDGKKRYRKYIRTKNILFY